MVPVVLVCEQQEKCSVLCAKDLRTHCCGGGGGGGGFLEGDLSCLSQHLGYVLYLLCTPRLCVVLIVYTPPMETKHLASFLPCLLPLLAEVSMIAV